VSASSNPWKSDPKMQRRALIMSAVFALCQLHGVAEAAGKPRQKGEAAPAVPAAPGARQASPARDAHVRPVETVAFTLPNGTRVDLAADLNRVFSSAVTRKSNFRPTESVQKDECSNHLALSAAITTLDLNVFGTEIRFGYTPTGELGLSGQPTVSGKVRVDVGLIGMDVGVWRCQDDRCAQVIASRVTSQTVQAGLSFEVDFSEIHTGADLLYKTPLGNALARMFESAMVEISASPRMATLPWHGVVREVGVGPAGPYVWFDGGSEQSIGENEAFTVFAPANAQGSSCGVYKPVGQIHTTDRVTVVSSEGKIEDQDQTRNIQVGDIVLVRKVSRQTN